MLACAFVTDGAVPEPLDNVSQGAFDAADQFSTPPPIFEMVTGAGCGLGCPWKPSNEIEAGDTPRLGLLMTKVTATLCGLLVAPAAVTVMVPLYVPGASPATFAETVRVAAFVPDVGATLSQVALSLTLQLSVPLPELLIEIV